MQRKEENYSCFFQVVIEEEEEEDDDKQKEKKKKKKKYITAAYKFLSYFFFLIHISIYLCARTVEFLITNWKQRTNKQRRTKKIEIINIKNSKR